MGPTAQEDQKVRKRVSGRSRGTQRSLSRCQKNGFSSYTDCRSSSSVPKDAQPTFVYPISTASSMSNHQTCQATATSSDSSGVVSRLSDNRVKDPYDIFPIEILDQILVELDQTTLFRCSMLSKRWFQHVIPHLWRAPFMKYFASWMKLSLLIEVQGAERGQSCPSPSPVSLFDIPAGQDSVYVGCGENNVPRERGKVGKKDNQNDDSTLTDQMERLCDHVRSVELDSRSLRYAPPVSYGALVRVLDFSQLYYIISDTFLVRLFPSTPRLEELIVHSPRQFSDTSLLALSRACPKIRRLELDACLRISDAGLESVLTGCHEIQTLVLTNGSSSLTDRFLSQLACSPTIPRTLRVLNLSNASHSITHHHPGLGSIAVYCPSLVHLDISCLSSVVTDEFLELLTCTSSLQVLNLAYCREVTDKGLIYLANSCSELREVDITALNLVTDKGILELKHRHAKSPRLVKGIPAEQSH